MANTTTQHGNFITITTLDADWNLVTDTGLPKAKVKDIQFNSDTVGDIMIVRDGGNDNAAMFEVQCVVADQAMHQEYGGADGNGVWCTPYIDISDCTITATSKVIIEIA